MKSYAGAQPFLIPCGKCIGCRLGKSRDWATRMHHEASLHDENSFITLTYTDQYLPEDGSLSKRALQLFFKRLRKGLPGRSVRYFASGEYGERNWRPHYHALLFGYQFPDLQPWRKSPTGHILYRSAFLESLWPFGHCEVGHVSHQSAGYCARYAMKKINGDLAVTHYVRPHPVTGQFYRVIPEFGLMSSRPGLGADWFAKYHSDAFPSDFVTVNGKKVPVPLFYKRKLSEMDALSVTARRKAMGRKRAGDNTPARLAVREELQTIRAKNLKRDLGDDQ